MKKKSKSLELLKELQIMESKQRYPTLPEYARTVPKMTDVDSNGLTKCIIKFLQLKGHQAERISVTGRYIDQSKIVEDCLGFKKKIGTGKYIASSMQKGSADISATIKGRSVKIEVKMNDKQSYDQKSYQKEVEKAGGLYVIVRNFDEFVTFYNSITHDTNNDF